MCVVVVKMFILTIKNSLTTAQIFDYCTLLCSSQLPLAHTLREPSLKKMRPTPHSAQQRWNRAQDCTVVARRVHAANADTPTWIVSEAFKFELTAGMG